MSDVGNFDTYFGVSLAYFHDDKADNLLEKATNPMAIIIIVVGLMDKCFKFLQKILYFFRVST